MLTKEYMNAKLKELKKELQHWRRQKRINPWPYVDEYIGTLERRIAAYEKMLPYGRTLDKHVTAENYTDEYWYM